MNLGLNDKIALVCGASKGIGKGCAVALAREAVRLYIVARGADDLNATAQELRAISGKEIVAIVADVTTPEGRVHILEKCPSPDILVTNSEGPAVGNFRDWDRESWIKALDASMVAPISLIQSVVDGMIERKFGRIVNITGAGIKAPNGMLALSNGARAGLTAFAAGLAREVASHNVTVNNVLPGITDTARTRRMIQFLAGKYKKSAPEMEATLIHPIPAGRFATVEDIGNACGFLCAATSGYITGQNLVVDGGAYPGMF